jgi:glycosyltransferase involved in cell wall biosynthesis
MMNKCNENPLVSIIIPTYKRSELLNTAINSVLDQTYSFIEVIIVDDNNPESVYRKNTEELMKQYDTNNRVKYIKHDYSKNGSAARNTGIKNSNGEYIGFLDDDDQFLPEKINLQIDKLSKLDQDWGGVYCSIEKFMNSKSIKKYQGFKEGKLTKELLLMEIPFFAGSSLLVKRKVMIELGGFDESFQRHQDWEFLIRFFRKYKLAFLNEILVYINVYPNFNNKISGKKLEQVKLQFLDKFDADIKMFELDIQKKIYKRHYFEIIFSYLLEKKVIQAFKWIKKTNSFIKISFKERIMFLIYFISSFVPTKLKKAIRKLFKIKSS